jgi:hypothetical protein
MCYMMGPVAAAILLYSVEGIVTNPQKTLYTKLCTRRQTLSTYSRLFRALTQTLMHEFFINLILDLMSDELE